jgi:NADH:ubiquinone oxidoreductase subunit K
VLTSDPDHPVETTVINSLVNAPAKAESLIGLLIVVAVRRRSGNYDIAGYDLVLLPGFQDSQ